MIFLAWKIFRSPYSNWRDSPPWHPHSDTRVVFFVFGIWLRSGYVSDGEFPHADFHLLLYCPTSTYFYSESRNLRVFVCPQKWHSDSGHETGNFSGFMNCFSFLDGFGSLSFFNWHHSAPNSLSWDATPPSKSFCNLISFIVNLVPWKSLHKNDAIFYTFRFFGLGYCPNESEAFTCPNSTW